MMKKSRLLLALVPLLFPGPALEKNKTGTEGANGNLIKGSFEPVVVLELFTSEGCSSCPPADRLLRGLAGLGKNILPLSLHVDYWNRLGWTDPFSSSEISERQRKYADQFRLESVYTPQLVINGAYETVGSNRPAAEADIKKALEEPATARLSIGQVSIQKNKLLFTVTTEPGLKNTDLVAALVQRTATVQVKAGENRGAKLTHSNIVRTFLTREPASTAKMELTIPEGLVPGDWELVVFAQRKNDLRITGATVYKPAEREQMIGK